MPKTKTNHRLCNEDCNNCTAVENKQVALLLNVLALKFGEGVWHAANLVCPNLTVCPICRIDDFCHDKVYMNESDKSIDSGICCIDEISGRSEGYSTCEVAETAIKIFKQNKEEN